MGLSRRTFIAATCTIGATPALLASTPPASAPGFEKDWAFLHGSWRVRHRRPFPPGSDDWRTFGGTMTHRTTMAGQANVEDYVIDAPPGRYRAMSFRSYDIATRQWSIWWIDSRYPTTDLLPPMRGRFENGRGAFYSEGVQDGKRVLGRFIWTGIDTSTPRWEQATSRDDGATWQSNWMMDLSRG